MWYKRRYFIFIPVMLVLALTVPTAVEAIPDSAAEYMARLASNQLYSLYSETDKPPESVEPPLSSEEPMISSEETSEELPENAIAVQAFNFSRYEEDETPKILLANETEFVINPTTVSTPQTKKAAVLIVHSHGTESYLPTNVGYYIEGEEFRSTDIEQNVIAAGEAFAETLRSAGFKVYHDKTMYDEGSYETAYAKSRAAVKKWLSEHEDIGYVFDIHRDSIENNDGHALKTICRVNDESMAQVMLVVGTDEAGATHPDWHKNLALAVKYQKQMNHFPTLARPIYLRSASYNQQLCEGSLLLEIGSSANTVEEAKRAAVIAAECFAKTINN